MSQHQQAGEQGIALISVLWVVTALALLMSAFNATVRTSATMVDVASLSAQRRAAMQSALELAVLELIRHRNAPVQEENSPTQRHRDWLRGERAETFSIAGFTFLVRVHDQNGLVDVNLADRKLLADIFTPAATNRLAAENLADRIVKWREEPSKSGRSIPGDAASRSTNKRSFGHPSQLMHEFSMPADVFARIASLLTVYSSSAMPVLAVAPDAVRRAIAGKVLPGAGPTEIAGAAAGSGKEPRAYRLSIELPGATISPTIGLQSIILLGADKTVPYRVLDWDLHSG